MQGRPQNADAPVCRVLPLPALGFPGISGCRNSMGLSGLLRAFIKPLSEVKNLRNYLLTLREIYARV